MLGEAFFSLPLTRVVRFLDQEGVCLSFTGRLFYAPAVQDCGLWSQGPREVSLVPCERFGCYTPTPEYLERYRASYGVNGMDPVCGVLGYRVYHVLLDTGLIPVRGMVRWVPRPNAVFGPAGVMGTLDDAEHDTSYVHVD